MERIKIALQMPISYLFISMIILGIILLIIPLLNTKKEEKLIKKTIELPDDEKNIIFNLYKDIEIAKMKHKYLELKDKLNNELYKKTEKELKEIKKNKQKIISTDIKLENLEAISIKEDDNIKTIEVLLHVSQYDYIVDKNKQVIRGTDEERYQIEYKLKIEKNKKENKYIISDMECVAKWIEN